MKNTTKATFNKSIINLFVAATLSMGLAACSQDNEMTSHVQPKESQDQVVSVQPEHATNKQDETLVEHQVIEVDAFTTAKLLEDETVTKQILTNEEIDSSLFFAFDSSRLSNAEQQALADVAKNMITALKSDDQLIWQLVGHTDSVGTELYNQKLAKRRATAVADYLIQQGVDASSLSVVSLGKMEAEDKQGVASEDYLARRVEIHVFQEETVALAKQLQNTLSAS